jgi:hypothetical protein
MTPALVLFVQYLPDLISAAQSVPSIVNYIAKMRENFTQSGEWTQEQDDAFSKSINDLINNPPPEWDPKQNQ